MTPLPTPSEEPRWSGSVRRPSARVPASAPPPRPPHLGRQALSLQIALTSTFAVGLLGGALNKPSLALTFLVFSVLLWRDRSARTALLTSLWRHWRLGLIFAWAGLSVLWSPIPSLTLDIVIVQWATLATCVLLACGASRCDWTATLRYAAYVVLAVNALYSVAAPSDAWTAQGLRGVYGQKNNLGAVAALCSLILIASPHWRRTDAGFLILGMGLLWLSESKTSISLFASLLVLLALWQLHFRLLQGRRSFGQQALAFFLRPAPWLLMVLAVLPSVYAESTAEWLLTHLTSDFWTGRGELWKTVLSRSSDVLLTGHGLGVFWGAGDQSEVQLTDLAVLNPLWVKVLAAADGGYIDLIGGLGFVGLTLMLWVIFDALIESLRPVTPSSGLMCVALLLFPCAHNLTETTFFLAPNMVWLSLLFVSCHFKFRARPTSA